MVVGLCAVGLYMSDYQRFVVGRLLSRNYNDSNLKLEIKSLAFGALLMYILSGPEVICS